MHILHSYINFNFPGDRFLYLDPHFIHTAEQTSDQELNNSYTCEQVYSLSVNDLDPSMAFGFVCTKPEDATQFWKLMNEV